MYMPIIFNETALIKKHAFSHEWRRKKIKDDKAVTDEKKLSSLYYHMRRHKGGSANILSASFEALRSELYSNCSSFRSSFFPTSSFDCIVLSGLCLLQSSCGLYKLLLIFSLDQYFHISVVPRLPSLFLRSLGCSFGLHKSAAIYQLIFFEVHKACMTKICQFFGSRSEQTVRKRWADIRLYLESQTVWRALRLQPCQQQQTSIPSICVIEGSPHIVHRQRKVWVANPVEAAFLSCYIQQQTYQRQAFNSFLDAQAKLYDQRRGYLKCMKENSIETIGFLKAVYKTKSYENGCEMSFAVPFQSQTQAMDNIHQHQSVDYFKKLHFSSQKMKPQLNRVKENIEGSTICFTMSLFNKGYGGCGEHSMSCEKERVVEMDVNIPIIAKVCRRHENDSSCIFLDHPLNPQQYD